MTDLAFFMVLAAAVMHAAWNAMVKINTAPLLAISTMFGSICVLVCLYIPWLEPLPWSMMPALALTLVFHFGYKFYLLKAFAMGDFSQAYPIARGSAPVWVLIISTVLLPQQLSYIQMAGVVITILGIIALSPWHRLRSHRKVLGAALFTGLWIASYTIVDGYIVNQTQALGTYIFWLFLLDGLIINAYAAILHKQELFNAYRNHWHVALLGGGFSLAAYSLCLWAMTIIPVAMVSALRETSVLAAVLMAGIWLKEPLKQRHYFAAGVVCLGLITQKLG